MTGYPVDAALILVAVVPSARDLEIARLLGWYRIPLRFAPKIIDVDYLAFYQTSAFGEADRWQISKIAPVYGHELTVRKEIIRDEPEHPRANEEYYKLQLGPVEVLPRPILAKKWRRITFLYTTGELLRSAETLQDLVVRSEDREVLWKSLRERAQRASQYQTQTFPESFQDVDPILFAMLGGFDLKIREESQE